MTALQRGLTLAEARRDPAHRLWFAYVDALDRANLLQTKDAFDRADDAWWAFLVDFTSRPSATATSEQGRLQ